MRQSVLLNQFPFTNQRVEDDGFGIQVGNSFVVPSSSTGDFTILGGRVYFMTYNAAFNSIVGLTVFLHEGDTPDFSSPPIAEMNIPMTISGQSMNQWKDVLFTTPVPMVKGTKYTVSYRFTGSPRTYFSTTDSASGEVVGAGGDVRIPASGRTYYRYDGEATSPASFLACVDIIVDDGEDDTELPPVEVEQYLELGTPTATLPHHVEGWKRTPQNTGLSALGITEDDLDVYSGSLTITGKVSNKIIYAGDRIRLKSGGHLDRCMIYSSSDGAVSFEGTGAKMTNCDLILQGEPNDQQIVNVIANYGLGARNGLLVSNVRTTGGHIQMWCDVSGTIEDFYAYDQFPEVGYEQHRDGFTRRAGTAAEVVIRRSRFVCDQNSTTGAFFVQDTFGGGAGKVESYQCMYEGAGYVLTLHNATDLVFNDCRVWSRQPYQIAPLVNDGSTIKEWVNVYQYNPAGAPLFRGTEMPNPIGGVYVPPDETVGPGNTLKQLQDRGYTIKYIAVEL